MRCFRPKSCERCGDTYSPTGPGQRFCPTPACRFESRPCIGCGKMLAARSDQRYCSRRCWFQSQTTKRRFRSDGYAVVYVGPSYPNPRRDGRMLEHRHVMEQALGRSLLPYETVHHINGDKGDNRLENLQLRSGRHGKGVALQCRACGSHDIATAALPATVELSLA